MSGNNIPHQTPHLGLDSTTPPALHPLQVRASSRKSIGLPPRLLIGALLVSAGLAMPAVAQDDGAPADGGRNIARPQPEAGDEPAPRAVPRPNSAQPGNQFGGRIGGQLGGQPGGQRADPAMPNGGAPRQQPAGQPGRPPAAQPRRPMAGQPAGPGGPDDVVLPVLAEALELRALVEYVAETLGIGIAASEELSGSVVINSPMTVPRDELLDLLDSLLETQGFTIIPDDPIRLPGWFKVIRMEGVGPQFGGPSATTRIIPTPTIRPSTLAEIINTHMGGVAAPGTASRQPRIAYLDDLGVIIVTDTPRRIMMLEELVSQVLDRSAEQQFIRFDLAFIAANVARQRVLELVGQQQPTGMPGMPPGVQQGVPSVAGVTLTHLADRLSVDQQGNALILRGFPEEASRVETLLRVIDQPNQLEPRQYFAGSGAMQIAQMAERFGFGRVEAMEPPAQQQQPTAPGFAFATQQGRQMITFPQQQQQTGAGGGPVLVVDSVRGSIIYYGTPAQHAGLEALINIFDAEMELVDIRAYKIKNQLALNIADILNGLVFQQQPTGGSAFLPGAGGANTGQMRQNLGGVGGTQQRGGTQRNTTTGRRGLTDAPGELSRPENSTSAQQVQGAWVSSQPDGSMTIVQPQRAGAQPGGPGGPLNQGAGSLGGDDVFIMADPANNQVLVKAPARQQEEFARLIEQLDQRRPQVFLEVQIVSVSANDDFRLAFETQLLNTDSTTGVVSTNFGLSTIPQGGGDILTRKTVPLGLSGVTAALIKSDSVPLIINALRREADTRILSSPQLLVDDNEMAEIVSLELQPTAGASQGTATTVTTFTGFEEAGTRLLVRPSISDGGYLRLAYEVELSNFVGTGTSLGDSGFLPPPKQTRNVSSDSVTIPGDTTIIVGGIQVDSENKTVVKVPLLGDIPLIGHLFRDTNRSDQTTRLYVFITPRIMRDPHFRDLILLTRGPQAEAGLMIDLPPLEPVMIEMIETTSMQRARQNANPDPAFGPTTEPDPWSGDPTEY